MSFAKLIEKGNCSQAPASRQLISYLEKALAKAHLSGHLQKDIELICLTYSYISKDLWKQLIFFSKLKADFSWGIRRLPKAAQLPFIGVLNSFRSSLIIIYKENLGKRTTCWENKNEASYVGSQYPL